MRKFAFAFIAFLFAVVCYAAPPPEPATLIAEVDNVVCQDLTAITAQDAFVVPEVKVEVINVTQNVSVVKEIDVREVATIRKYSNLATVNSAATMNDYAELTVINTDTECEVVLKLPLFYKNMNVVTKNEFQKPLKVNSTGWVITDGNSLEINTNCKRTFQRNKQNSNYGYPLSANEQHGN